MPLRRVRFLQGSYCEMYALEFMGRSFISVLISSCGTSQRLTCTYRSRARALHQEALSQRGHPIIGTWEGNHREALSRTTYYSSQTNYQHIADLLCIVTTLNLLYLAFPPMPIHTTIHNIATSPVKTSHRSLIDHRGRPFLTTGCTYHMVHLAENLLRNNLLK